MFIQFLLVRIVRIPVVIVSRDGLLSVRNWRCSISLLVVRRSFVDIWLARIDPWLACRYVSSAEFVQLECLWLVGVVSIVRVDGWTHRLFALVG